MVDFNKHLRLDIYGIFRLPFTASKAQIRKRFQKLSLRFHPDKLGRPPTPAEEKTWYDILDAWEVFNDASLKNDWDNYSNYIIAQDEGRTAFLCLCEHCSTQPIYNDEGEQTGSGVVIENRDLAYKSPISMRWFCSPEGATQWETEKGYTPEVHGYTEADQPPPQPSQPPTPTRRCPGCNHERPFVDGGRGWKRYSLETEQCCSEYCLDIYLQSIGIAATKCNFRLCRKIKRAGDVGEWMRDPVTHTSYCSPTHFAQEKSINDINAGLGNPSSNDPLQTKKTAAITEIEGALNQTPPVTNNELENTNRGWRNEIQNSTSAPNITTIKDRVLQDISRKRQAKNPLPGLKSTAINQILAELAKNPPVDESEITNRNWKKEINDASSGSDVNSIKNKVLADIRNKRAKKGEKSQLKNLLSQAKEQKNWDDYQNLKNIFLQIEQLSSSDAYQQEISEIQAIKNRLQELNPTQYQQIVKETLNQLKTSNKLSDDDLDDETNKAISEAIQDPTNDQKTEKAKKKYFSLWSTQRTNWDFKSN